MWNTKERKKKEFSFSIPTQEKKGINLWLFALSVAYRFKCYYLCSFSFLYLEGFALHSKGFAFGYLIFGKKFSFFHLFIFVVWLLSYRAFYNLRFTIHHPTKNRVLFFDKIIIIIKITFQLKEWCFAVRPYNYNDSDQCRQHTHIRYHRSIDGFMGFSIYSWFNKFQIDGKVFELITFCWLYI